MSEEVSFRKCKKKKKPLSNFPAFLKTRDLTDVGADGSVTESIHAHTHTHTARRDSSRVTTA